MLDNSPASLVGKSLTQMLQQVGSQLPSVSRLDPRQDRDCRTVPAFYSRRPESITSFNKTKGIITEVPINEFEAEQSITWSESPYVHIDRKRQILSDENLTCVHLNLIFNLLNFKQPNLAITDINDTVGKGVIATQDFKQYDIIGLYSGLLDSTAVDNSFKPYGYLCNSKYQMSSGFSSYYGRGIIDAGQVRNYTSYIQHAPDEESLASLKLPEDVRNIVATSNIIVFPFNHLQWPVMLLIAARDINKGEQFFFDYGTYWQESQKRNYSDGSYALFDLDSEIIGTVDLEGSFQLSSDYKLTTTKKTIPVGITGLNIEISVRIKEQSVTKDEVDLNFRENIRHVLRNARKEHGNGYHKLFSNIEECLSNKDPVDVCNNIIRVMTKFKIESKKPLEITMRELYLYLNRFIAEFNHFQKTLKSHSQFKGLLQEESQIIKDCINEITNRQWTFSQNQQIFHTSSNNKAELASIKDVFARHGINPTKFGLSEAKVWYLAYSVKDFCLENFLKLKKDEFESLNDRSAISSSRSFGKT